MYIFDYGAPTGLPLALAHPERVTVIISQNGNAYEEGLGDAWAPIQRYWQEPTSQNRDAIRAALSNDGVRNEYFAGMSTQSKISPEGYTLDAALMNRQGNTDN
jgi:pimeloyl-ACP methyl ester carboxylesterase